MTLEGCNQVGTERSNSGVREHPDHAQFVRFVNHGLGGQVALLLGSLVIQQVIAEGAPADELAAAGRLEPLGGSFASVEAIMA
jgi:putative lipase involved disintegration of autophagic bodies